MEFFQTVMNDHLVRYPLVCFSEVKNSSGAKAMGVAWSWLSASAAAAKPHLLSLTSKVAPLALAALGIYALAVCFGLKQKVEYFCTHLFATEVHYHLPGATVHVQGDLVEVCGSS